jgi:hypothetical protein
MAKHEKIPLERMPYGGLGTSLALVLHGARGAVTFRRRKCEKKLIRVMDRFFDRKK